MEKFLVIHFLLLLGCRSTKNNPSAAKSDSAIVEESTGMNQRDSAIVPEAIDISLSSCIKNKIDSFKLKPAHEQPQRVVQYMYKGKTVYYVVMHCCDFYNEVYDEHCKLLGSPDGGFTGKGDGKLPDFFTEAKNEKLIWTKTK